MRCALALHLLVVRKCIRDKMPARLLRLRFRPVDSSVCLMLVLPVDVPPQTTSHANAPSPLAFRLQPSTAFLMDVVSSLDSKSSLLPMRSAPASLLRAARRNRNAKMHARPLHLQFHRADNNAFWTPDPHVAVLRPTILRANAPNRPAFRPLPSTAFSMAAVSLLDLRLSLLPMRFARAFRLPQLQRRPQRQLRLVLRLKRREMLLLDRAI